MALLSNRPGLGRQSNPVLDRYRQQAAARNRTTQPAAPPAAPQMSAPPARPGVMVQQQQTTPVDRTQRSDYGSSISGSLTQFADPRAATTRTFEQDFNSFAEHPPMTPEIQANIAGGAPQGGGDFNRYAEHPPMSPEEIRRANAAGGTPQGGGVPAPLVEWSPQQQATSGRRDIADLMARQDRGIDAQSMNREQQWQVDMQRRQRQAEQASAAEAAYRTQRQLMVRDAEQNGMSPDVLQSQIRRMDADFESQRRAMMPQSQQTAMTSASGVMPTQQRTFEQDFNSFAQPRTNTPPARPGVMVRQQPRTNTPPARPGVMVRQQPQTQTPGAVGRDPALEAYQRQQAQLAAQQAAARQRAVQAGVDSERAAANPQAWMQQSRLNDPSFQATRQLNQQIQQGQVPEWMRRMQETADRMTQG